MANIAVLDLDNSNLVDLSDEELEAVSGGVVGAVIGALAVSADIAVEGLSNPGSTARQILINQIRRGGVAAAIGALGVVASAIVVGAPVTVTAASLD